LSGQRPTHAPPPLRCHILAAIKSHRYPPRRPSYPPSRGFLPWRLSDDGPCAGIDSRWGRHPKPFTSRDVKACPSWRQLSPEAAKAAPSNAATTKGILGVGPFQCSSNRDRVSFQRDGWLSNWIPGDRI
jgi:hypothetical protein